MRRRYKKSKAKPQLTVKEIAIQYLARREHARRELAQKLKNKKLCLNEITSTLDELEYSGLLSDARYADMYTRSKHRQGYGPRYVEMHLRQNGVSVALIETSLADYEWKYGLKSLIERKFNPEEVGPRQDKVVRYLINRGFAFDQVLSCVKHVIEEAKQNEST